MKLSAGIVGTATGAIGHEIDARWLMAYAAALGETDAEYFDTRATLRVHPLFPVCYEWPAAVALRERVIPPAVYARVVHATHDLRLHRLPRAGDVLTSVARVARVEARRPGAYVVTRISTLDSGGAPVSETDYGALYRGVDVEGSAAAGAADDPPETAGALAPAGEVAVAPRLAHLYTECARIWNPIHTDLAVALDAGLPGLILHGTATLALSVSRALAASRADPAQVRRVRCRFAGMVPMPSTLVVRARGDAGRIAFETHCAGAPVITRGEIETSQTPVIH